MGENLSPRTVTLITQQFEPTTASTVISTTPYQEIKALTTSPPHVQTDWERLSNLFVLETSKHPELFDWLPTGPYDHESYTRTFDTVARHNRGAIIFAILLKGCTIRRNKHRDSGREAVIDEEVMKVADGTFAGTIGLLNTDLSRSRTEMGYVSLPVTLSSGRMHWGPSRGKIRDVHPTH